MVNLKRVLVAFDKSVIDETLVRYVTMLSNYTEIDKIYFINVVKSLELPEKIAKKYPELLAPVDEAVKKDIRFLIDQEAGNQLKVEYEIDVVEGNRAETILKWAKVKEIDLIVMGKKSGTEGEGFLSNKILKLAPCSVAMVPEVLPMNFKKILVPIDFSEASKLAMESALDIARRVPELEITVTHIYEVPSGYSVSGKSYEEFAEIMLKNAEESYNEFIKQFDIKGVRVTTRFELNEESSIAKKIYYVAVNETVSAIVIGSKGRTQAAAVIVGSIAEKVVAINSQIPTIVVKQKSHNMGFLEALLEL